jgi:hypothetical protein
LFTPAAGAALLPASLDEYIEHDRAPPFAGHCGRLQSGLDSGGGDSDAGSLAAAGAVGAILAGLAPTIVNMLFRAAS